MALPTIREVLETSNDVARNIDEIRISVFWLYGKGDTSTSFVGPNHKLNTYRKLHLQMGKSIVNAVFNRPVVK